MPQKRPQLHCAGTLATVAFMWALPQAALAQEHNHHGMDHSQHAMSPKRPAIRSSASYDLPNVTLTDTNGNRISLTEALSDGPVMVNFIYTSCTTICPPMSATFAEVQYRLAAEGKAARLVSISIDPEHDVPARLKEYAERFHAGKDWQFLTGSHAESVAVQRAFHVYRGNKMNHAPVTLLRASSDASWVRMEGFASAADLVNALRAQTPGEVASRK